MAHPNGFPLNMTNLNGFTPNMAQDLPPYFIPAHPLPAGQTLVQHVLLEVRRLQQRNTGRDSSNDARAPKRQRIHSGYAAAGKDQGTTLHPKNPDACLSALPNELLLEIAKLLPKSALFGLALVDIKMNKVATEVLYSSLDMKMSELSRRGFVRAFRRNRDLAKLIKIVEGAYDVPPVGWETLKQRGISYEEWTMFQAINAAVNVRKLAIKDESIEITPEHVAHNFQWLQLLTNAAAGVPTGSAQSFSNLKALHIAVCGNIRLEKLSAILTLPSLEEVTFGTLFEKGPVADWGCPPKQSNIKKLILNDCFIDDKVIGQLLSSVKDLEHFAFSYCTAMWEPFGSDDDGSGEDNPKGKWVDLSWERIGETLGQHKNSLRVLKLVNYADLEIVDIKYPRGYAYGILGPLGEFSKLTHVLAPLDALVRSGYGELSLGETLPVGVEKVDVRIEERTKLLPLLSGGAIRSLANEARGLKAVHVSIGEKVKVGQLKLSAGMDELKEAGVEVEVTRSTTHRVGRPVVYLGVDGVDMDDDLELDDDFESEDCAGYDFW